MAEQRLSSQAGPVNIMYELDDSVLRPPIPPKEPEEGVGSTVSEGIQPSAYGYGDNEQQYQQQAGNSLNRSLSGYAPQVIESNNSTAVPSVPPIPESPISTPHSPQSVGTFALPTGTISSADSYRQSLAPSTKYAGPEAGYAAPHYNAPIAGYYTPQYNPDQSFGVQQQLQPPYVPQSPPPIKPEYSHYAGAVQSPPVPPPVGVTTGGEGKKKKRICGMTVTVFSLLCVALFVIIAGAVLGGIFGSGVLTKKDNDKDTSASNDEELSFPTTFPTIPIIDEPTSTIDTSTSATASTTTTTTTTATTTTSSNTYAYAIPTGTWTVTAALTITTGSCIDDLTDTNYKEVYYCPENKTETIVIKDFSTTEELMFTLDMDEPVRRRGVVGSPPTGPDTDKNEDPFWTFTVTYQKEAFEGSTGCLQDMTLFFLLGRTKKQIGFYESAWSPNSCLLPHGGNSTANIRCGCGYL